MTEFESLAREFTRRNEEFIASKLDELLAGMLLCVHDMEFERRSGGLDNEVNVKFIARTVAHVVESPDECKARIGKTLYGLSDQ